MREPDFWWRPGTGSLLAPAAAIYGAVARVRMRAGGGAASACRSFASAISQSAARGKTPAALAVGRLLVARVSGRFFLSRGYGGQLAGPLRVDLAVHSAADVGDEPLLLARLAPTIVARDRLAGAESGAAGGAGIIVMDDGFQNPSLKKDLSILVVDSRRGIGNGRVIPAGPLRAPLEIQLARAQALIVIGPANGAAAAVVGARRAAFRCCDFPRPARTRSRRSPQSARAGCLAFAGIADPEKFYAALTKRAISPSPTRVSFDDHHRYTAAEARMLIAARRPATSCS